MTIMSFCLICSLRRLCHFRAQHHFQSPPGLGTELEDLCRFSLNSLTALLAILVISGSKVLQPMVLTVLMYTITLRLALSTRFLQDYPAVARFLHVIPLLGISCMAGTELVFSTQSPALAAVCVLLGILPLVTIFVHHECVETSTVVLPVRMELPLPLAPSGFANTTPASN